jgi:hypothetical protein
MKLAESKLRQIAKEELNSIIQEQSNVLLTVDSGGNVYKDDGRNEPLGLNFSDYDIDYEDDYKARNQFLKDLGTIDDNLSYKVGSPTAGPVVKLPDGKLRGLRYSVAQFAKLNPKPPKPEYKPSPPKKYKDQSVIDALLAVGNDDQTLAAMVKDLLGDPKHNIGKIASDPRISSNKKINDWIHGAIYTGAELEYRKGKGPGTYVGD